MLALPPLDQFPATAAIGPDMTQPLMFPNCLLQHPIGTIPIRDVHMFASQSHFLFGVLLVVLFRPAFGPAGAVFALLFVTLDKSYVTHIVPQFSARSIGEFSVLQDVSF